MVRVFMAYRRALFLVPNERTKYKLKHHTVYTVQLVLLERPGLRASSSCPLATWDETGLIFYTTVFLDVAESNGQEIV